MGFPQMSDDENARQVAVVRQIVRALDRVACLYEQRVTQAAKYDAKLADDGVRLAAALERMRKIADEAANAADGSHTNGDEHAKRELLTRLEDEIEATITQRLAALAGAIPAACPQCGCQLQELASARGSAPAKWG